MQLGPIQFSLDTRSFEELEREVNYRWPSLDRLGRRPAHQWLGVGEETLNIRGVVYPSYDPAGHGSVVGGGQIEGLRSLASMGSPNDLITGTGRSLGKWVVKSVKETQSEFIRNGAPRKQQFTMDLAFYGSSGFGLDGVLFAGGTFFVPRLSASISASVSVGGVTFSAGASIGI